MVNRENVMAVATHAEDAGYGIIGIADHVLMPISTDVRYPYTANGVHPAQQSGQCFDAMATLAFWAGCTKTIKLLTSVAVVPHRPAVVAARLLQTADILSGGRVIAGVGAGWLKEEFDAIGAAPFAERGAVTDEYILAWKELWTQNLPKFSGKYVNFDNVVFEPKPVSKPHPPIWVGGESAPSLRRVAKMGDAWYPVSNNASVLLNTPAKLKEGVARMHAAAEKIGRDPATIDISYVFFMPPTWRERELPEGGRQMFSGSSDAMLEDAAALKAVGVNHLIVYLQRPTIEETLETLHRFGEEVVRKS